MYPRSLSFHFNYYFILLIFFCVCLSVRWSSLLFFSVSVCVGISIVHLLYRSTVHLPVYLSSSSTCLSTVHLPVYLSTVHLPVSLSTAHLPVYLSIVHLPIDLAIYLPSHLYVSQSSPSIHQFIYLSPYPLLSIDHCTYLFT